MGSASDCAVSPSISERYREGTVFAGKYRIERVLGRGGMGLVVAARHLKLDERVAIKFLSEEGFGRPDYVERFLREARASIKVRSEHVVRVMDVDTSSDGIPYIVMELLEGSDLATLLSTRGPLPVSEACDYLLQVCEGLAAAHALGIVHRDLKTANLFLTRSVDGNPCVKVLDFGICKLTREITSDPLDITGPKVLGSPSYMSPEQMLGLSTLDAGSDIWALGVVAFKLLSDELPFVGSNSYALCDRILHSPPRALRDACPDAPPELEAVVRRCLEKARAARYQDVAEFAAALLPFAPPSSSRRVERIRQILRLGSSPTLSLVDSPLSQVLTANDSSPHPSAARGVFETTVRGKPAPSYAVQLASTYASIRRWPVWRARRTTAALIVAVVVLGALLALQGSKAGQEQPIPVAQEHARPKEPVPAAELPEPSLPPPVSAPTAPPAGNVAREQQGAALGAGSQVGTTKNRPARLVKTKRSTTRRGLDFFNDIH